MIELIFVESGSFRMGSDTTEQNESPSHNVILSSFYIGKYPITQKEWFDVFGKMNPYHKGPYYPIEQITWIEAIAFCNKLSSIEDLECCYIKDANYIIFDPTKNGYRLPTEAEWEFSSIGGNKSKKHTYSGSNDPFEVAWFKDNSDKQTHEVGKLKPNELGIYDLSGNIYEICWDVFKEYTKDDLNNPCIKLESTDSERHVLRGGNCHGFANRCRNTSRRPGLYMGFRQDFVGFRIAKNAQK
jgi:formylglycine-generating enzyme